MLPSPMASVARPAPAGLTSQVSQFYVRAFVVVLIGLFLPALPCSHSGGNSSLLSACLNRQASLSGNNATSLAAQSGVGGSILGRHWDQGNTMEDRNV